MLLRVWQKNSDDGCNDNYVGNFDNNDEKLLKNIQLPPKGIYPRHQGEPNPQVGLWTWLETRPRGSRSAEWQKVRSAQYAGGGVTIMAVIRGWSCAGNQSSPNHDHQPTDLLPFVWTFHFNSRPLLTNHPTVWFPKSNWSFVRIAEATPKKDPAQMILIWGLSMSYNDKSRRESWQNRNCRQFGQNW